MRKGNLARRPRNGDSGGHWISYSDMMASILMVFILAVIYFMYILQNQSLELEQKTIVLADQEQQLEETRIIILSQTAQLETNQVILAEKENELDKMKTELQGKEDELIVIRTDLEEKGNQLINLQHRLDSQQAVLEDQERQLREIVGVKTDIIRDLNSAFERAGLAAQVDPNTGDIILSSSVFFASNSYMIKDEGKELLDRFLPVYLDVLMGESYADFVGEIIIEGHTDSDGSYMNNLKLSQNRALTVAEYCMQMPCLTQDPDRLYHFQRIITATGRSDSEPVFRKDAYGNELTDMFGNRIEDKDASRRVAFKFRLKDTEMITQMQQILNNMN